MAAPSLSSGISPLVLDWSMGLSSYHALRFSFWILSLTSWPQSSGSQLWLVFLINLPSSQLSSMLDPNLWNHLIPDHAFILSFWLVDCSCTAHLNFPRSLGNTDLTTQYLYSYLCLLKGFESNSLNFFSPSCLKNIALCLLSLGNLWAVRTNGYFMFISSFYCSFQFAPGRAILKPCQ